MQDYFLRAADQSDMDATLLAAGLVDGEGNAVSRAIAIDRIGQDPQRVIGWNPPVGDDPATPILRTLHGYHANLRVMDDLTDEQAAAIAAITVTPAHPLRVWL